MMVVPVPVMAPAVMAMVMMAVVTMVATPVMTVMMPMVPMMAMAPCFRRIRRHHHEATRHQNARRYNFTPHAFVPC